MQGLRRFYAAFLVRPNLLRLIRARDGETTVLAETAFEWSFEKPYLFTIETLGQDISVAVDGVRLAAHDDSELAITDGGFALIVQGGSASTNEMWVAPPTPRLARRTTHMTEPHVIECELSSRAKRESGMAFVSEPDATLGVMEQLNTRHGGNRF